MESNVNTGKIILKVEDTGSKQELWRPEAELSQHEQKQIQTGRREQWVTCGELVKNLKMGEVTSHLKVAEIEVRQEHW